MRHNGTRKNTDIGLQEIQADKTKIKTERKKETKLKKNARKLRKIKQRILVNIINRCK